MHSAAELLRAIAAIAWPAIVLVLFLVYRPQVIRLLSRLRRGKLFGQEFVPLTERRALFILSEPRALARGACAT
jgi:hypothetical protein